MIETAEVPALLPALPEIVLALGAMVLLMVGAFRGERATRMNSLGSMAGSASRRTTRPVDAARVLPKNLARSARPVAL